MTSKRQPGRLPCDGCFPVTTCSRAIGGERRSGRWYSWRTLAQLEVAPPQRDVSRPESLVGVGPRRVRPCHGGHRKSDQHDPTSGFYPEEVDDGTRHPMQQGTVRTEPRSARLWPEACIERSITPRLRQRWISFVRHPGGNSSTATCRDLHGGEAAVSPTARANSATQRPQARLAPRLGREGSRRSRVSGTRRIGSVMLCHSRHVLVASHADLPSAPEERCNSVATRDELDVPHVPAAEQAGRCCYRTVTCPVRPSRFAPEAR
jgi:hypothetical protein